MFRDLARKVIPFGVRLGVLRLRRLPMWFLESHSIARHHANAIERTTFHHLLASHSSPLGRQFGERALQEGKEINVRLAARKLDGLVIPQFRVFSHHHTIGFPTRLRGFRKGLELRNQIPSARIGGGLCQVSNSVHWVALQAGMRITERHRHGLDLFPDQERTVPFGAGATVVYNSADLRFENPFDQPVMLRTRVTQGSLIIELWSKQDPHVRIEISEVAHRFYKEDGFWFRENRLRRRITTDDGTVIVDQEVAHNVGRVLYEPRRQS